MTSKAFGLAQLGNAFDDGALGSRNRIINGAMVIDKRNAGTSVTANNVYSVDRWIALSDTSGKWAIQQNSGSVTPPVGFTNYLGGVSSSAYSPISSDYFGMQQRIEGFNVADFGWGTSNAKTVTLSFWVRSSLTGTFGGSLMNSAQNRSYPFPYTISSADTWEYKTITISGDTTGTWNTNSSAGIFVFFSLGAGSSRVGTANAWTGTANVFAPSGSVDVVATNGATFYLTGVQLEAGDTATPFEHRSYGQELALCQRYYQKYVGGSTYGFAGFTFGVGTGTAFNATMVFEQEMRVAPSLSSTLTGFGCYDGSSLRAITAVGTQYTTTKGIRADMTVGGGGLTTGDSYSCYGSSSTVFQLNAEL